MFLFENTWTDSFTFELSQIWLIWILTNFVVELLGLIVVSVYVLMEAFCIGVFDWRGTLSVQPNQQIIQILLV